jgi:hypothetical protein
MGYGQGNEYGGSRAGTLFWLIVLAAIAYAAVKAGPAYYGDFMFQDKLQEIARTPPTRDIDGVLRDRLLRAIREHGLDDYMSVASCKITSSQTSRTIACVYEREVTYLPGFRRMVRFEPKATSPII